MSHDSANELILGWTVNRGLDPDYWLRPRVQPGGEIPRSKLVGVAAAAIGNHTALVAQSGSGKSFFLGRLIEEIATRTKARCLILDPNGDFLQVEELANEALWDDGHYDPGRRVGYLPTETREEFEEAWSSVKVRVRSGYSAIAGSVEPFELPWASLPPEFLTVDLSPLLASQVHDCHRFVQELAELAAGKLLSGRDSLNLLEEAQQVLSQQRGMAVDLPARRTLLEQEYRTQELLSKRVEQRVQAGVERFSRLFPDSPPKTGYLKDVHRPLEEEKINRALELCLGLPKYVSEEAERIYFGRARRYEESNVFSARLESTVSTPGEAPRLDVVDLSSIPRREMRQLAVSSLIATEFDRLRLARQEVLSGSSGQDSRSPTFLVIDEAHNLIPAGEVDQSQAALREQFRTIAAEGRKFGFFLILVSQRPDKLDHLVVSECENRVVMKLGSQAVLDTTRRMLGLEDLPVKKLEKALEFELGRGLLYGGWVSEEVLFYCAARRTKEGGGSLSPKYWAIPYEVDEGGS